MRIPNPVSLRDHALRFFAPAAREACGALIPLAAIDPTCVLHTLDQLLEERAAEGIPLVRPGVEDDNARGARGVTHELACDEAHDCGFARAPSPFETDGFTAVFAVDEAGDSRGDAVVSAAEGVCSGRFVGEQAGRAMA